MSAQLFPIFDETTEQYLGMKERNKVHTEGDWHKGIQANIIRAHGASFDILMQTRSANVDIAKHRYDQSLATQMIDRDDLQEEKTLFRGLREELAIEKFRFRQIISRAKVQKTYEYDLEKRNNEIISLYLVEVNAGESITINSEKTAKIEWLPWDSFLAFYEANHNNFCKTVQFYLGDAQLRQEIERQSYAFLGL